MKDKKELEVGGGAMVGRETGQKCCQAAFKLAGEGAWEHSALLGQPHCPREGLPPSPVHRVSGWGGVGGNVQESSCPRAQPEAPTHPPMLLGQFPACQIPPPHPPCALTLPGVCPPLSQHWLDTVVRGEQLLWPSSCLYNWQQKTRHPWLCLQW